MGVSNQKLTTHNLLNRGFYRGIEGEVLMANKNSWGFRIIKKRRTFRGAGTGERSVQIQETNCGKRGNEGRKQGDQTMYTYSGKHLQRVKKKMTTAGVRMGVEEFP